MCYLRISMEFSHCTSGPGLSLCTTCEPVSVNLATAPTDQIEQIPLYPRLSDTEIETENLWLLKMKNKHNNTLYN